MAEMEKLNNQVDAIVSDVAHLDSRFARSQGEGARLAKMQDLVKKVGGRREEGGGRKERSERG